TVIRSSRITAPGATVTSIQAPTSSPVAEFHAVDRSRSTRCPGRIALFFTVEDTRTVLGTLRSSSTCTAPASSGAASRTAALPVAVPASPTTVELADAVLGPACGSGDSALRHATTAQATAIHRQLDFASPIAAP